VGRQATAVRRELKGRSNDLRSNVEEAGGRVRSLV
jgi:hypothetical protein